MRRGVDIKYHQIDNKEASISTWGEHISTPPKPRKKAQVNVKVKIHESMLALLRVLYDRAQVKDSN